MSVCRNFLWSSSSLLLRQRTLPSRILHLLRGQAIEHTEELCEILTTQMRQVLRCWPGHPTLNAIHWNLAHLSIVAGGLGLRSALAARTAAPATGRRTPCGMQGHAPRWWGPTIAGAIASMACTPGGWDCGRATSHARGQVYQTTNVSSLRREEDNMSAAIKHNWARNRSNDEGTANSSYTGQGAWLRATPGTAANTISSEAFRFNLSRSRKPEVPSGQDRLFQDQRDEGNPS